MPRAGRSTVHFAAGCGADLDSRRVAARRPPPSSRGSGRVACSRNINRQTLRRLCLFRFVQLLYQTLNFEEGIHQGRVELATGLFANVLHHPRPGPGKLVRSLRQERVNHVGEADCACVERDGGAGKAVGVAGAVPAFVVPARDLGGMLAPSFETRDIEELPQELLAGSRVKLDQLALFRQERPGLEKDPLGNGHLAHVVEDAEEGGPFPLFLGAGRGVDGSQEPAGQGLDTLEVSLDVRITHLGHPREGHDEVTEDVDVGLVGANEGRLDRGAGDGATEFLGEGGDVMDMNATPRIASPLAPSNRRSQWHHHAALKTSITYRKDPWQRTGALTN